MRKAVPVRPEAETRQLLDSILLPYAARFREAPALASHDVPPEMYRGACEALLKADELGLDYIRCYTAAHYEGHIELFLMLYSTRRGYSATLHTALPDNTPAVESIRDLMPGADWYEREIHDMFGVSFSGLPEDDRILLAEDIIGHPLRKDFRDDRPAWMLEPAEAVPDEGEGGGGQDE